MSQGSNEERFYKILEEQFVGAQVKGDSGYINLLKMKNAAYVDFRKKLQLHIEAQFAHGDFKQKFKEEMFDRLFDFFKRYFSENGSVFFNKTPFNAKIYEQVYDNKKDIELFYKTRMLYYVKSDMLYDELSISVNNYTIKFDVSDPELHKKSNEKRSLLFEYDKVVGDEITLKATRAKGAKKTEYDVIAKNLDTQGIKLSENEIEKYCKKFLSQNEFDYFINKNVKSFLTEQWESYSSQYLLGTTPTEDRIKELGLLLRIGNMIIEFIAQFEEELRHIWEKPKIVRNSNYVITGERLKAVGGEEILKKLDKHPGWEKQVKDWAALMHLPDNITKMSKKMLPIDTKYFPELKDEIVALFENIDEELDGYLIKSENWQALNTILPKFKDEIQTLYSDPPFNKESEAGYHYNVKYKDSTWITILDNRLELAKEFLKKEGSSFLRCDYNGNMYARMLLDNIFGSDNFVNEIIISRSKFNIGTQKDNKYSVNADSLFLYSKTEKKDFHAVMKPRENVSVNKIKERLESYKDKKITDTAIKEITASEEQIVNLNALAGPRRPHQRIKYENGFGKGEPLILLERDQYHFKFTQFQWDEISKAGKHRWQQQPTPLGIRRFIPDKKIEDVKVTLMVDKEHRAGYEVFDKKTTKGIEKNDCVFLNVAKPDKTADLPKCKLYQNIGTKDKPEWEELKGKWEVFDKTPAGILPEEQVVDNNWTDIPGNENTWKFETENSEKLVRRVIETVSDDDDRSFVMDFFLGSGTTIATAHKLGKRWIGIELGDHFDIASEGKFPGIVQRMKSVLAGEQTGISKGIGWKGGGFFKYYDLEQHEDVLNNIKYSTTPPLKKTNQNDPQDVFLTDLKFLEALDKTNGTVDLSKLYLDVDIAETLSNIRGKKIKTSTNEFVEFDDGETIHFDKIDNKIVKDLLWWSN